MLFLNCGDREDIIYNEVRYVGFSGNGRWDVNSVRRRRELLLIVGCGG